MDIKKRMIAIHLVKFSDFLLAPGHLSGLHDLIPSSLSIYVGHRDPLQIYLGKDFMLKKAQGHVNFSGGSPCHSARC